MTLPVPAFTVLSGGNHASNNFAIQVFHPIISVSVLPLSHASSLGILLFSLQEFFWFSNNFIYAFMTLHILLGNYDSPSWSK